MATRKTPPAPPAQAPAPAQPLARPDWVAKFVHVACELWPEVGPIHANRVGLARWASRPTSDPAEAAQQWVAEAKGP